MTFEFLFTGQGIGHSVQSRHKPTEPENVGGFGGKGFVLATEHTAQLVDGYRPIAAGSNCGSCRAAMVKKSCCGRWDGNWPMSISAPAGP